LISPEAGQVPWWGLYDGRVAVGSFGKVARLYRSFVCGGGLVHRMDSRQDRLVGAVFEIGSEAVSE